MLLNRFKEKQQKEELLNTLNEFYAVNDISAVPAGFKVDYEKISPMDRIVGWGIRPTLNRQFILVNIATGDTWVAMVSYEKLLDGSLSFHQIDALYKANFRR